LPLVHARAFCGLDHLFSLRHLEVSQEPQPEADYHGVRSHASTHLEASVVLIEAVLLLGFALPLWGRRVTEFPVTGDRLEVRCIGYQFGWYFPLSRTGRKVRQTRCRIHHSSNPLGIDPNDPQGGRFLEQRTAPHQSQANVVRVSSRDVIPRTCLAPDAHSAGRHARHGDSAMVPSDQNGNLGNHLRTTLWYGHSAMRATYTVEEQKEFDEFQKEQLDLRAANTAPAAPRAPPAPAPGVQPNNPRALSCPLAGHAARATLTDL
jgi:cytochrome c oxidase subunit 2